MKVLSPQENRAAQRSLMWKLMFMSKEKRERYLNALKFCQEGEQWIDKARLHPIRELNITYIVEAITWYQRAYRMWPEEGEFFKSIIEYLEIKVSLPPDVPIDLDFDYENITPQRMADMEIVQDDRKKKVRGFLFSGKKK